MPVCYMMVGVPGSGKSSAIAQLKSEMPHLNGKQPCNLLRSRGS